MKYYREQFSNYKDIDAFSGYTKVIRFDRKDWNRVEIIEIEECSKNDTDWEFLVFPDKSVVPHPL